MIGPYTRDEIERLDAEWKRVNKITRATDRVNAKRAAERAAERDARLREIKAEQARRYEMYNRAAATAQARREARTDIDRQRERRSRIDWSELIDDPTIVERQEKWERRQTAMAMHDAGLTSAQIGERLGVSRGRANQLVNSFWRGRDTLSPAEQYLNNSMAVVTTALKAADYSGMVKQTMAAIMPLPWPRQDDEDTWIWMGLAA
jgi:hypothetical protein